MFHIVLIDQENEPLKATDGKPMLYETGAEAASAALFWQDTLRMRVKPRKVSEASEASDNAWKARELGRFESGEYEQLPWITAYWWRNYHDTCAKDHYAHVSLKDGAKVAFTESAEKGRADRQTVMNAGRYLAKYFKDYLSESDIAQITAEFGYHYSPTELLFANTPDDIERVYVNGPRSCMAYAASRYRGKVHPARVYGAGDLAVAYIKRDNSITARCLVWPDSKLYCRIYGDETRLAKALDAAGYVPGSMRGAKLLKIETSAGIVAPYSDCCGSATDDGEFLIMGDYGDISLGQTTGIGRGGFVCHSCDREVDDDETYNIDGYTYCDSCTTYCEHYDESVPSSCDDRFVYVQSRRVGAGYNEQYWCANAGETDASECFITNRYYPSELCTEVDGETWGPEAFDDHGFICDRTGAAYHVDKSVQLSDGTLVCKDWFDKNGVTVDGENYEKGDEPQLDEDDDTSATFEASNVLEVA